MRSKPPTENFHQVPEDLSKNIFSFLDGQDLARAREVYKRWNKLASEERLWEALCLKKWQALKSNEPLLGLISQNVAHGAPYRWRLIYPVVQSLPQWSCRLHRMARVSCNLIVHQIAGPTIVKLAFLLTFTESTAWTFTTCMRLSIMMRQYSTSSLRLQKIETGLMTTLRT